MCSSDLKIVAGRLPKWVGWFRDDGKVFGEKFPSLGLGLEFGAGLGFGLEAGRLA